RRGPAPPLSGAFRRTIVSAANAPTMRVHGGCHFTSVTGGDEPMPSRSWRHWNTVRARELDELEAAHTAIGGSRPGPPTATQQINRASAVLLASQFQGFCRDLHSECVDYLVALIPVALFQVTVQDEFLWNRALDRGNATQATIAGDFKRLGLDNFWSLVD